MSGPWGQTWPDPWEGPRGGRGEPGGAFEPMHVPGIAVYCRCAGCGPLVPKIARCPECPFNIAEDAAERRRLEAVYGPLDPTGPTELPDPPGRLRRLLNRLLRPKG